MSLDPCTLDQYIHFVDMMSNQDADDSLSVDVLRARYRTSIIVAKMIKKGVDVFDITGKDAERALEDFKAGRYYTIEDGKLVHNPDQEEEK